MPRYIPPPPPLSSSMGVIISCHDISTPLSSSMGLGVIYYATVCQLLCLVVWQDHDLDIFSLLTIIGEGLLYSENIFLLPTLFGEWVIISRHYFFTSDNIGEGMWLYRDIIFSLPTIFGEGVIISWHYIFTPLESGIGGDYIWISSLPTFDSGGGRRYQAVLLYIYSYSTHRTHT